MTLMVQIQLTIFLRDTRIDLLLHSKPSELIVSYAYLVSIALHALTHHTQEKSFLSFP